MSTNPGAPMITLLSSDGVEMKVGRSIVFIRSSPVLHGCLDVDIEDWRIFTNIRPFIYLERDIMERSILIKNMLDDLGDSGEAIPISNVSTHEHSPIFWNLPPALFIPFA